MNDPSTAQAGPIDSAGRAMDHLGQHDTRIAGALFEVAVADEVIS